VIAALGIHPQVIPYMTETEVDEAFAFLTGHLGEADQLGEVGLDYKHATSADEQDRQDRWLARQLELAAVHRKPINLHSRRALRQVMDRAIAFQERTGLPAQLHWFTQSKKLVRQTNQAGVYVSAGPTTLLADDACAVAAAIAADLLLLETDCPVPYGGESARPSWVGRVLERLAGARGVEPAELEAQVETNFRRFLAGESPARAGGHGHGSAPA
jgi:TatD DNase family protein